mgnify:FL=1
MRTEDAFSPNVTTAQVAASLAMFAVLYAIVFGVFLVLLNRLIQAGPPDPPTEEEVQALPDTWGAAFQHRSRVSDGSR